MTLQSTEIRSIFFDFFRKKAHQIVPSAPMVNKHDPTLMFANAGMNQFKDYFLGNETPSSVRIADTQKCLRVSGKHNDLDEVGIDSYHHTMFEMLGNWSFGDYFKMEAIEWAWELLTDVYGLDKNRIYATIFGGDEKENLSPDTEAESFWKNWVAPDRILRFGKKDNFWEMGDTGPCGPCSEIHIDLRPDLEREQVPGDSLVNKDHPHVIELWNLVFIQYNRKSDGTLEELPSKHVDTGMGFERLSMVLQGKMSNYDSDIFVPLIRFLEKSTGIAYQFDYSGKHKSDIAMRVVADHIRAIAFGISDGELPGNTGAGYVLRRILRRAVRYYYSFLHVKSPIMHRLVPLLAAYFEGIFPEIKAQEAFIANVIEQEESAFLHTLENGLKRFDTLKIKAGKIAGDDAFELYDTYGFPIDLTRMLAAEQDLTVDEAGFEEALSKQRQRSRADASKSIGDWVEYDTETEVQFVGYDVLRVEDAKILKTRTVMRKDGPQYQIILDKTPFYPEGGGQVGDTGTLQVVGDLLQVNNTIKENALAIHCVDKLPAYPEANVIAQVHEEKRRLTENNHTATHLLHAALRKVLGAHVQQRGSLLNNKYLRFDFSHFSKMTDEEISEVERIVNARIRQNIALKEDRSVPIEEAQKAGAMMLFGEKYGERVRMITFDNSYSVELCGGCHVPSTGKIGLFKIVSESAIAAGVRRIEAITAYEAEKFVNDKLSMLSDIQSVVKSPVNPLESIEMLVEENKALKKQLEKMESEKAGALKSTLLQDAEEIDGIRFLASKLNIADSKAVKNLIFQLEKELSPAIVLLGIESEGKATLMLSISKNLTDIKGLHAGNMIREIAKEIKGGGGGQPFFASAGGKDPKGLERAFSAARTIVEAEI